MKAKDVMSRHVFTLSPGNSVAHAAQIMLDNAISGLPVMDSEGALVGIVTEGDLVSRIELGHTVSSDMSKPEACDDFVKSHGWCVGDVMTTPVVTVSEETTAWAENGTRRSAKVGRRHRRWPSRQPMRPGIFVREQRTDVMTSASSCFQSSSRLARPTLGVDSGYSQADVTAFAKVLTGWSIGTRPGSVPPIVLCPGRPFRLAPSRRFVPLGRETVAGMGWVTGWQL